MKTTTPWPWWLTTLALLSLGLAGGGVLATVAGIIVGRM